MENRREKLDRAKKRVDELKDFYSHLIAYLIVIPFLVVLNYWTNDFSYVWFLWAAIGWGIGLLIHATSVFWFDSIWGQSWEKRKIREFMEKDRF